jgi:hypothetical protein
MWCWLRVKPGIGLSVLFLFSFFHHVYAQEDFVEPVTHYRATVYDYHDTASQHIVLDWTASATSGVIGYHICTGDPCLGLDTVFGRETTQYDCESHSPVEPHVYGIFAFDSADNVSAQTPPFGPSVLTAEVPECASTVQLTWTPYVGMPGGVRAYTLMMFYNWNETDTLVELNTVDADGPYRYTYDIPDSLNGTLGFFVFVIANDASLNSQSNSVAARRRTSDTAAFLLADQARLSVDGYSVDLRFSVDTAYHAPGYSLYRRRDDGPWVVIAQLPASLVTEVEYVDRDINPYDSAYCYRLGVLDGCGINEKFSDTLCVILPEVPDPEVRIPNIVIAGDSDNGLFLPFIKGLKGDLYELYIYDRNGLQVFHTSDPQQSWDPVSAGVHQGVYAYMLHVRFINNIMKTYTGSLLVVK